MTGEESALFFGVILALITAIIGPITIDYLRFRAELKKKEHDEIESRYINMIKDQTAFYISMNDEKKKEDFLENYRLAWLYAPDEVIIAMNGFLKALGATPDGSKLEKTLQQMVLATRKAFRGKTLLKAEDYLVVSVTKKPSGSTRQNTG